MPEVGDVDLKKISLEKSTLIIQTKISIILSTILKNGMKDFLH